MTGPSEKEIGGEFVAEFNRRSDATHGWIYKSAASMIGEMLGEREAGLRAKLAEAERALAEAAMEINCAGPVAHRIRILKQAHAAALAEAEKDREELLNIQVEDRLKLAEVEKLAASRWRIIEGMDALAETELAEEREKREQLLAAAREMLKALRETLPRYGELFEFVHLGEKDAVDESLGGSVAIGLMRSAISSGDAALALFSEPK